MRNRYVKLRLHFSPTSYYGAEPFYDHPGLLRTVFKAPSASRAITRPPIQTAERPTSMPRTHPTTTDLTKQITYFPTLTMANEKHHLSQPYWALSCAQ